MEPLEIVNRLSATTSRLEKEQILKEAWEDNSLEFFKGAKFAYDPLITFGVQQVAKIDEDDDFDSTYSWLKFEVLASKLSSRKLTGNAARDAIDDAASECSIAEWNTWYRQVLLKDLRCGITQTTINKVLKAVNADDEFLIPIFSCQLAKDGTDHPSKMKGPKLLDMKLDGSRLLTVIDKPSRLIRQFTRNGKENVNFRQIVEQLEMIIDDIPASIVLDGEVISRSFQDLMKQMNRKEEVDTSDAKLALFDIIPLDDFFNKKCDIPQAERHSALSHLEGLFQSKCPNVYVIPKLLVDLDTEKGQKKFKEFNEETLKAGYEGVMIKDPNAGYECDRSFAWLKYKPFISLDLNVIGSEEGTGKNEGRLGALLCEGEYDGKQISVSVGGGYTDAERDDYWSHRTELVGRIVEVEADVVSQNQNGTYSLRFPRFSRFRDMKAGEGKI